MSEPQNLVAGIQAQCNRVRDELLPEYAAIGPAGMIGSMILKTTVKEGEDAIASGDVLRMLAAYKALEGCE